MTIATLRKAAALLLAAALLGSLGLTGCSTSDDTTDAGSDATSELTQVEIAFSAPLTGDYAVYGQGMKRAVQLALAEANASAEVIDAGYEFVIRAEDDQGDPKQAVNVANLLASDMGVVGVIGHFNSGCSIPASSVYQDAGMAMVSVSSNPQMTAQGFDVVNRIAAKDDAQGTFAANMLTEMYGFKSLVVIDDSTQYGQGLADEFTKQFEALGGEIRARESIQSKEVDFQALVTKIGSMDPDAIYYAGGQTEGGLISKQAKESGLSVPVVGGDLIFSQEYIDVAGAVNAEGDVATMLGLPLDQQPGGLEFKAAYEAEYDASPEAYDSYAYDSAWIFVKAVLEAGTDRADVAVAVRGITYDGITGTTKFDENGDTSNQAISAYQVVDGAWAQIID